MAGTDADGTGRAPAAVLGTRELLDALARGDGEDHLRLEDILAGLSRQVFGMLLFVSTLPAFIPIPGVGGAISGPATVLVGVHLLVGMRRLWLPRFVARRGPRRSSRRRSSHTRRSADAAARRAPASSAADADVIRRRASARMSVGGLASRR